MGERYFDLPDLLAAFEDSIKLQTNSGFLTGIRGVVDAEDGLYVAVDASYVKIAVSQDGMKYFEVKGPVTVRYIKKDEEQKETVADVVLLPYDIDSVSFTPDQFRAIAASEIKRKDMVYGREMKEEEIIKDGNVIHPALATYSSDIFVPLVEETFKFSKREYGCGENMGLFLPTEPSDNAKGRALVVYRLRDRSRLYGNDRLGDDGSRLLGAVPKDAEGVAQKLLAPWENSLVNAGRRGDPFLYTPQGDYAKLATRLPTTK